MHELGKLPPQAIDIEEAVLGACLMTKSAIETSIDVLLPEAFYKTEHKTIYQAILFLFKEEKPVDLLTVTDLLRKTGDLEKIGGHYVVTELCNHVASDANVEYHSRIIFEKYMLREIIKYSGEALNESYADGDCFDIADNLIRSLELVQNFVKSGLKDSYQYLQSLKEVVKANFTRDGSYGMFTGIQSFDEFSMGLHPGNLVVIAAETSQGKTALAVSISKFIALRSNVAFFTLEMTGEELCSRFLSIETNISSKNILYNQLWDKDYEKVMQFDDQWNILIDSCEDQSWEYLERTARKAVTRHGCKLVVFDYLQLMYLKNSMKMNQNQMIGFIANKIKNLAKTLNVPIILLSQLRREDGPVPSLKRLKMSGDIENAADVVWFVWRPSFYEIGEIEIGTINQRKYVSSEGLAEHIIAKGRSLGTTKFITQFNPLNMGFEYFETETKVPF